MSSIVSQETLWDEIPLKRCPQCMQSFPATSDYFHRNCAFKDGLCHRCKACNIAHVNAYNEKKKAENKGKASFDPNKTKCCPRCQQTKPLTEEYFGRNATNKDGINDICKICNNTHSALYKAEKQRKPHSRQKTTHCSKGHPLVEGNLRKGKRECLTCHREREKSRTRSKPGPHRPTKKEGFCPNGHPLVEGNLRTGKNAGNCLTCHRESAKRRYHRNPQKMVTQASAYAKTHRKQINTRYKKYRERSDWKAREKASALRRRAKNAGSTSNQRLYDDEMSHVHLVALHQDPCCYCGKPMQHIDHIVPVAQQGEEHWSNLTAACQRCNNRKQDKSLLEFLIYRLEYPD